MIYQGERQNFWFITFDDRRRLYFIGVAYIHYKSELVLHEYKTVILITILTHFIEWPIILWLPSGATFTNLCLSGLIHRNNFLKCEEVSNGPNLVIDCVNLFAFVPAEIILVFILTETEHTSTEITKLVHQIVIMTFSILGLCLSISNSIFNLYLTIFILFVVIFNFFLVFICKNLIEKLKIII